MLWKVTMARPQLLFCIMDLVILGTEVDGGNFLMTLVTFLLISRAALNFFNWLAVLNVAFILSF